MASKTSKVSLIHKDIPHMWLLAGVFFLGLLVLGIYIVNIVKPFQTSNNAASSDKNLVEVAANDPNYWTCQSFSSIWVNDCRSYNDYINKSPKCRMNVKSQLGSSNAIGHISYKTTGPKEVRIYAANGTSELSMDCSRFSGKLRDGFFTYKIGQKPQVYVYNHNAKVGDPVKFCVVFRDPGAPGRAKLPDLTCEAYTNFMK